MGDLCGSFGGDSQLDVLHVDEMTKFDSVVTATIESLARRTEALGVLTKYGVLSNHEYLAEIRAVREYLESQSAEKSAAR